MRTKQISFRVTFKLHDQLDQLCKEEGYKNISRYLIAMCLAAVQAKRRNLRIRSVANADPKMQDFLIDGILGFPTDMDGMVKALKTLQAGARKGRAPE